MRRWPLIPMRSQWQQWSLPSKLTAVGTLLGLVGILLSIVLFLWPSSNVTGQPPIGQDTTRSNSSTVLTSYEARLAIESMVHDFPGISPIRVQSITSPVNGLAAVAIEPPYREFPNVVLFRYDEGPKRWKRVFEGLSIGIQPEVSMVLDLHTIGEAIDIFHPKSEEQRHIINDIAAGHGAIVISYDRFSHHHRAGKEGYYIDKRDFQQLAKRLFASSQKLYGDDTCKLYDMPGLFDVSLSHDSGRFKLIGNTLNNQQWTVTFTDVNGSGYLDHKFIKVKPTK